MRKINALVAILIGVLMIISVAGCGQQYVEPEEPAEFEPESEQVVEQEPEPEPEPEPVVEEELEPEEDAYLQGLSSAQQRKVMSVRRLMDEGRNRDENYFYRYTAPKVLQSDVWVKGDVMKRSIHRANELDKYKTYNMVYLYRSGLKAEGYCETTKSKCWEGKGPFPETYSKWKIKTPKDWLLELGDEFTWVLDNKIHNQLYHIIDFVKDGQRIRVHINDYRGWPYRVDIYASTKPLESITMLNADETYIYDDMDIGGVSDDDVTPG